MQVAAMTRRCRAGAGVLCWRFPRPAGNDDIRGSFTVSAARIQCTALVDGNFAWGELTAFRWMLKQDKKDVTEFERSDGTGK
jgi:hypothetical protein